MVKKKCLVRDWHPYAGLRTAWSSREVQPASRRSILRQPTLSIQLQQAVTCQLPIHLKTHIFICLKYDSVCFGFYFRLWGPLLRIRIRTANLKKSKLVNYRYPLIAFLRETLEKHIFYMFFFIEVWLIWFCFRLREQATRFTA